MNRDVEIETLLGPIRGSGTDTMYRCPFHDDSTASLSISRENGLWQCFGCSRRGNLFQLARLLGENPDEYRYNDAIQSTIERERPPLRDFTARAESLHRRTREGEFRNLWDAFRRTHPATDEAVVVWRLGLDEKGVAISFPFYDEDGKCRGIKYRDAKGNKWAEKESSFRLLYGVEHALGKGTVVICEGESDTIAVWSSTRGNLGVCGVSGGSVSEAQWRIYALELIWARRIYLALDADSVGDRASETAMSVFGPKAIRARPTRGKDICGHLLSGGTLVELGIVEAEEV